MARLSVEEVKRIKAWLIKKDEELEFPDNGNIIMGLIDTIEAQQQEIEDKEFSNENLYKLNQQVILLNQQLISENQQLKERGE